MFDAFVTPVELPDKFIQIDHLSPLVLMGSCFSEHIGRKLVETKFSCDVNPFGVLYNPLSISLALNRIMDGIPYTKSSAELIFTDRWHSLMHHSNFSAESIDDCVALINTRLELAYESLRTAQVLFLTWGSAYVYEHCSTGMVVGNCHKLPDRDFIRRRLSVQEIVNTYMTLIERLRLFNPNLRILFTVSPIRHCRDGIHANQLSKSILLLAIDELVRSCPELCYYFPAYEIMMDELRDYRFYADDMLHPSTMAIKHIWKRFSECCFSPSTISLLSEWEQINKSLNHKPFNPSSKAHKQFLTQLVLRIERLKEKYPTFDLEKELSVCRTALER